jgi:hypothetical protein
VGFFFWGDFQLPEFDKNLRKKNHEIELYMVQVGSQKYKRIILKFSFHILLLAKFWLNIFNGSWPLWLQPKIGMWVGGNMGLNGFTQSTKSTKNLDFFFFCPHNPTNLGFFFSFVLTSTFATRHFLKRPPLF